MGLMESHEDLVTREATRKQVFFDLEKSYFVKEGQEKGERWLAEIAAAANTEYVWTYDAETKTWHHLVADKSDLTDTTQGRLRHRLTLPESFKQPPSKNSINYHIHPAAPIEQLVADPNFRNSDAYHEHAYEVLKVRSQLPSTRKEYALGDIEVAMQLIGSGYSGFKIVTPLGITSIEYDAGKFEQVGSLGSLTLKFDDLIQAIKTGGIVGGIEDQLRRWNEYAKGVFKISFEPFTKVS